MACFLMMQALNYKSGIRERWPDEAEGYSNSCLDLSKAGENTYREKVIKKR